MARISAREYASIAGSINDQGIWLNEGFIELQPENSAQVAEVVRTLLAEREPRKAAPPPVTFDTALQRFRAASETLRGFEERLSPDRSIAIARELTLLLSAAAGWGVQIQLVE